MATSKTYTQANQAAKYVLQLEGLDLFVSDKQGLTGCNLTENVKKARKFSIGFDSEADKAGIWTAAIQLQCNNSDMRFKAVAL
ncbi:MAG: hypothetical protein ACKVQB_07465 [Bacteroidia bacterium]